MRDLSGNCPVLISESETWDWIRILLGCFYWKRLSVNKKNNEEKSFETMSNSKEQKIENIKEMKIESEKEKET